MRNNMKRNKKGMISDINVTPFVDVMLVLLIIFMVTSPMLIAGVNVDLPETSDTPITGNDEPLAVSIDKHGNVYIQDTKISNNELIPKLQAITKEKKDTRIFVRGDKNVDYGKVMNTVTAINSAGFSKVALITQISNK